jgi:carbamoyl-phosphate synthase large subunit
VSVHFRELEVWRVAMRLATSARALAAGFAGGAHAELAAALERAAATIPDHIAQGHTAGCLRSFAQRLASALEACSRVRAGLVRTRDLGLAPATPVDDGLALADQAGRMLQRLHEALTRKLQAEAALAASQQ